MGNEKQRERQRERQTDVIRKKTALRRDGRGKKEKIRKQREESGK